MMPTASRCVPFLAHVALLGAGLLSGCGGGGGGGGNPAPAPPVIQGVTATPSAVARGQNTVIKVTASDANGDSLAYAWIMPPGFSIVSGQGTAEVTVNSGQFRSGAVQVGVSDGSATVFGSVDVATIDGVWGAAATIESDDGVFSEKPQLAMNAAGSAMAVWLQVDVTRTQFSIWANRYAAGGGWGVPQRVDMLTVLVDNPQVAMDAAGNAIVVWQQWAGTRVSIWARRYSAAGGTWGTPEILENLETGDAIEPQVAMDSAGNAMVVWFQDDATRFSIWANRYVVNSGWVGPVLVETDDTGSARKPQLAIDGAGNAMAVWSQSNGSRFNVWANRFSATGGWGAPEKIETTDLGDASGPQVAMDAAGNALCVWPQSDGSRRDIWANRYVAGVGWGTAVRLESTPGDALDPQVAIDGTGNAFAVWSQPNGSGFNIYASRFSASSATWDSPQLVENDTAGNASTPQLVVDAAGNAIVVWAQSIGIPPSSRSDIWANRFLAGSGSWGTPQLIETDDAGRAQVPQLAIDAVGRVIAVWHQFAGTDLTSISNVWAARFD